MKNGCGSVDEFAWIEGFHPSFASTITRDLIATGQDGAAVEKARTDQTTFGEYLLSIARGHAVFQMSASFLDGDFSINVPLHILEMLAPGGPKDRPSAIDASAVWSKESSPVRTPLETYP